jgi:biotin operon repressor
MPAHPSAVFTHLAGGPLSARLLAEKLGMSQPTVSRAIAQLGGDIVRIGAARSIQYALRDSARGLPDIPVFQVDVEGKLSLLGTLVPTRPEGFVMMRVDGVAAHSDGLPWWLLDMRPQGYIGRAYAARHGAGLGLPPRLTDWSDTDAVRALLAHGHDVVGSLLLGDIARDRFLTTPPPEPIAKADKAAEYARLAQQAAGGEVPGSSAAGEQPKFICHAVTPDGPRHVLVKFSERDEGPVTERWRDLLLAEHLALETLRAAGIAAAKTWIVDSGEQRFLEVERFDRVGSLGRRALVSLAALDAEFVGSGNGAWPAIARRLASSGQVRAEAADAAEMLWAFGTLIGNADMHSGNLSFFSAPGRPCRTAPAYDMGPMAFAPRSGGGLPDTLGDALIIASVSNGNWRHAEQLARAWLVRLAATKDFSRRFAPCVAVLERHMTTAAEKISRLG